MSLPIILSFGEPSPLYSNINFSFFKSNSNKERVICQLVPKASLPRYFLSTGSQSEDSCALVYSKTEISDFTCL